MNPTLAVIGTLRFPPEKIAEIRPHLKRLIDETRRHDACIAYDAAVDISDPGLIRFTELWPDQESLDRHLRAPHIEPWLAVADQCGLINGYFMAYDISGARSV
jgi:quinol monooxygenase YgiN